MCAAVRFVPGGNPLSETRNVTVAAVIVPPESFVTVNVMVAVPRPLASAFEIGGVSFAGSNAAVNVNVFGDDVDGSVVEFLAHDTVNAINAISRTLVPLI